MWVLSDPMIDPPVKDPQTFVVSHGLERLWLIGLSPGSQPGERVDPMKRRPLLHLAAQSLILLKTITHFSITRTK